VNDDSPTCTKCAKYRTPYTKGTKPGTKGTKQDRNVNDDSPTCTKCAKYTHGYQAGWSPCLTLEIACRKVTWLYSVQPCAKELLLILRPAPCTPWCCACCAFSRA